MNFPSNYHDAATNYYYIALDLAPHFYGWRKFASMIPIPGSKVHVNRSPEAIRR